MDSYIQITLTWQTLAEGQANQNSWTLNRISWTRISLGHCPDLVVVRSNQYKTPIKVNFSFRSFYSKFTRLWNHADPELTTTPYTNRSRRRSSCTPRQDPDEILKNLKAVKGELLGRSMSICGDKRGMRSNWFNYCNLYYIKIKHIIFVYYEKISRKIFFYKGGSLCMRPHKESVMEKPEPTSKYEDEQAGYV